MSFITEALQDSYKVLEGFIHNKESIIDLERAIRFFVATFRQDGRALACGNGGSMCDAAHFCEELTGRFRHDRKALAAISMNDPAHLSCVANDYGYEEVFSRGLEAWGRGGDTLLAISTSGNSKNIIKTVEKARAMDIKTVALLGKKGGAIAAMADVALVINSNATERIQEMHIKIIHILIEGIERELFPENY